MDLVYEVPKILVVIHLFVFKYLKDKGSGMIGGPQEIIDALIWLFGRRRGTIL